MAWNARRVARGGGTASLHVRNSGAGFDQGWTAIFLNGGTSGEATLSYRYVRPGYQLALTQRLVEAGTLRALVDSARLTTVVADDGQMMTELSSPCATGEQFLEMNCLGRDRLVGVRGRTARAPQQARGKLLLPLERSGADDAPVTVELTYVWTNSFPRVRGQMGFISPKLNVPLKNARWELFLPPDYDYRDFTGSMAREVAAKPSLLNFSLSEYLAMEKSSRRGRRPRCART
jgi:hypothetical protein